MIKSENNHAKDNDNLEYYDWIDTSADKSYFNEIT